MQQQERLQCQLLMLVMVLMPTAASVLVVMVLVFLHVFLPPFFYNAYSIHDFHAMEKRRRIFSPPLPFSSSADYSAAATLPSIS